MCFLLVARGVIGFFVASGTFRGWLAGDFCCGRSRQAATWGVSDLELRSCKLEHHQPEKVVIGVHVCSVYQGNLPAEIRTHSYFFFPIYDKKNINTKQKLLFFREGKKKGKFILNKIM